jgi:hypothetical protein
MAGGKQRKEKRSWPWPALTARGRRFSNLYSMTRLTAYGLSRGVGGETARGTSPAVWAVEKVLVRCGTVAAIQLPDSPSLSLSISQTKRLNKKPVAPRYTTI